MTAREPILKLLEHRPVRYLLVGAWNTALGYSLFAITFILATRFHLNRIVAGELALVTSNVLGVLQGYFLYKYLVFQTPHLSWLEFFRFSTVYAVQLSANLMVLPLLISCTHIHPLIAQAIVIPIFVISTYLAHHHVSFRHKRPDGQKIDRSGSLAIPVKSVDL